MANQKAKTNTLSTTSRGISPLVAENQIQVKLVDLEDTSGRTLGNDFGDLNLPAFKFKTEFIEHRRAKEEVTVKKISQDPRTPQIRFAMHNVADIYRNIGNPRLRRGPILGGTKVLTQVNAVVALDSSSDVSYGVDYPVSAQLVLTLPADPVANRLIRNTMNLPVILVKLLLQSLQDTDSGEALYERIDTILGGGISPITR